MAQSWKRKDRPSEDEVLEHGAKLFAAGDYLEALDYYRSLHPSCITPRIVIEIARVLASLAVEDNDGSEPLGIEAKGLLIKAIDYMNMLDGMHDIPQNDVDYLIGKSLLMIGYPAKSLRYLDRLAQADPDNAEVQMLAEHARSLMSFPFGITSFTKQAEDIWEHFAEDQRTIRDFLMRDADAAAMALAELSLPEGFDFMLVTRSDSEKPKLVLSPNHWKVELFKLALFRDLAPESVTYDWDIVLGLPETDHADFETQTRTLYADDVRCWPEFHPEDGDFSVKAYSKGLARELAHDETTAYSAFMSLADETLGEIKSMRFMNGTELLERPLDNDGFTLVELRELIDKQLKGKVAGPLDSAEACLDQAYEMMQVPYSEKAEADPGNRADIFGGMSNCPELVDEFENGRTAEIDNALADGCVIGYLYWRNDNVISRVPGPEALFSLNEEVSFSLAENVDATTMVLTGLFSGTKCCYIDIIAFDFAAAMEAARAVFEKIDFIDHAAFRTMRPGAAPFILKDVSA